MQSKTVTYLANAAQCEARAQDMPPTLRQDLVVLAEKWRQLASKAAAAADREGSDRGKADKIS